MKLCPQCNASLLPFLLIAVITAVVGFLTWLTLGLSDWEAGQRIGATLGAGALVGLALWQYVVSCMRRHCRHEGPVHGMAPSSNRA